MLEPQALTTLVVVESVGLVLTIGTLTIAAIAYRRLNRELKYARKKAEDARLQFKNFLKSCADALD